MEVILPPCRSSSHAKMINSNEGDNMMKPVLRDCPRYKKFGSVLKLVNYSEKNALLVV